MISNATKEMRNAQTAERLRSNSSTAPSTPVQTAIAQVAVAQVGNSREQGDDPHGRLRRVEARGHEHAGRAERDDHEEVDGGEDAGVDRRGQDARAEAGALQAERHLLRGLDVEAAAKIEGVGHGTLTDRVGDE